ncbi:zona pellucida sperm-binding protein 3-like [Eucyclogobius newberryi]|uniref:zona pellucida sperm-binding protein 3-like n=1 Tax=Eucyclogobius newberryi TaxID=166745 RepID=UPI003B5AADA5
MNLNMSKTLTWCMNILVLLTLAEGYAYNKGVDLSHRSKWENDVHPGPVPNYQSPRASPRAVAVRCHPDSVEIVVQADMFNTGLLIDGGHLRLGLEEQGNPLACRAVQTEPTQFTIWAHLMDCGTVKHPPSEEKIVYSNVLVYAPKPSSDGLLRLDGVTIPIECHYNKFYSVNSFTLFPTWASFVLRTTAEGQMDFSLRLMTGDWQFERDSHVYYVGDPIHFEASSILGNHKPLRIFVDHCVATVTHDAQAALRYDFIDHYGCLADAYLTNSSARFLSRTLDHRIQFQLDAFKFYQENTNQIYITCHLTAIPSLVNVKSKHRACSLIANRWCSADGNDEDCRSCGIPYPIRETSKTASATITSSRKPGQNMPKHQPANYMRVRQRTPHNMHSKSRSSTGLTKEEKKEDIVFPVQAALGSIQRSPHRRSLPGDAHGELYSRELAEPSLERSVALI